MAAIYHYSERKSTRIHVPESRLCTIGRPTKQKLELSAQLPCGLNAAIGGVVALQPNQPTLLQATVSTLARALARAFESRK